MSTTPDSQLTPDQLRFVESIAEAAADRAVATAFANLGLDPTNPTAIREYHADQLWTRNARVGASKIKVTVLGSIGTALLLGIWTIVSKFIDIQ